VRRFLEPNTEKETQEMNSLKLLGLLVCAMLLGACEAPRTFQDAGVYQGENYTITIDRVPDGLFRNYHISLNEERILTIEGSKLQSQADDCRKIAFYVSQCTFSTSYGDKPVRVVMETDGRLYQQTANFSVFVDEVLVRRITTPLL
jgi:hypothetical protein